MVTQRLTVIAAGLIVCGLLWPAPWLAWVGIVLALAVTVGYPLYRRYRRWPV